MILLIDNWDSFVYNLARYFAELGYAYRVVRTDAITLEEIDALQPSHLVLSPGPRAPDDAGICLEAVRTFSGVFPILGICLGHQVIGQAFGGKVVRAQKPMHGKSSWITHEGDGLFSGLGTPLQVARYHSLVVSTDSFPEDQLRVTAYSDTGEIMGLAHRDWPVYGLQFHPESILTKAGHQLLLNFIRSDY